jgi:hypothetical protein
MLNRLIIGAAGLVAGTLVAAPAVLGLSGNSSFSRDLQVPVPSGAHSVSFDSPSRSNDDGPLHDVGDDHGGARAGGDDGVRHELGDDREVRRSGADDGDDHGGLRSGNTSAGGSGGSDDGLGHELGDDSGARHENSGGTSGRSGSDDGSGHRGDG